MSLVTGGFVRSEREHAVRAWTVGPDRVLRWSSGDDDGGTVTAPIPGDQIVVAADVWSTLPVVVLACGCVYHAWVRAGQRDRWIKHMNAISGRAHEALKEARMAKRNNEGPANAPRLVCGYIRRHGGGRHLVAVDDRRRVLLWGEDGPALPVGPGPVPGISDVLAVEANGPNDVTVLLADGRVLVSSARAWVEIHRVGGATSEAGTVQLRALKGIRLGRERVEREVRPGDVFEATGEQARELLRTGRAEVAGPSEPEAA